MSATKKDVLAWLALGAALTVTASAEYQLARDCGFNQWVAAGVPAALDIYAVRALKVGRDVPAVVIAMIAVNSAAHLAAAGMLKVSVPLIVAVSAIAPLVLWRVHRLGHSDEVDTPEDVPVYIEEPAAPVNVHPVYTAPAAPGPDQVEADREEAVHGVEERPVTSSDAIAEESPYAAALAAYTPAAAAVEVDTEEPARLSAEEARVVIEYGWENGQSVRETAAKATRSPAYVQKVYTALEESRGARPIPGQLALVG
jgi:hypothetical protein